jgi:hypothetical protein
MLPIILHKVYKQAEDEDIITEYRFNPLRYSQYFRTENDDTTNFNCERTSITVRETPEEIDALIEESFRKQAQIAQQPHTPLYNYPYTPSVESHNYSGEFDPSVCEKCAEESNGT